MTLEDPSVSTPAERQAALKKNLIRYAIIEGVVILLAGGLWYLGVFTGVTVTTRDHGPLYLAYQTQTGDYANTKDTIQAVVGTLTPLDVHVPQTFGLYLDNPKTVATEALRAEAGVLLDEATYHRLRGANTALLFKTLDRAPYATAVFPLRHPLSILVGVFKVYPKMNAYLAAHHHPATFGMEIYDTAGGTITYLMPILHP